MDMENLRKLKIAVNVAREFRNAIGARNTVGLTVEEQVELDIQYRKASRDAYEAEFAYQAALDSAAR